MKRDDTFAYPFRVSVEEFPGKKVPGGPWRKEVSKHRTVSAAIRSARKARAEGQPTARVAKYGNVVDESTGEVIDNGKRLDATGRVIDAASGKVFDVTTGKLVDDA